MAERHRRARRLHARSRAPLLPGAVPAGRREDGPVHHRIRRRRSDPGTVRHHEAADLPVPARRRRTELRRRGQLLPGRVRRILPEPPVAHRRTHAARHHGHGRELGARRERHAEQLPAVHGHRSGQGHAVDAGLPRRRQRLRRGVRQLRDQHDPARIRAAQQRHPAAAHRRHPVPEHRGPADRRGPVMELVLRRMG